MIRLLKVLFVGVVFALGTSCGKKLDLVEKWGLEGAGSFVLTSKGEKIESVTLSRSAETREFLKHLRSALEDGDMELLAIGWVEVQLRDGTKSGFSILLNSGGPRNQKVAVQNSGDHYYWLPDRFLTYWRRQFPHASYWRRLARNSLIPRRSWPIFADERRLTVSRG